MTSRKEQDGRRQPVEKGSGWCRPLEKGKMVDGRCQQLPFSWSTAGSPFHHSLTLFLLISNLNSSSANLRKVLIKQKEGKTDKKWPRFFLHFMLVKSLESPFPKFWQTKYKQYPFVIAWLVVVHPLHVPYIVGSNPSPSAWSLIEYAS